MQRRRRATAAKTARRGGVASAAMLSAALQQHLMMASTPAAPRGRRREAQRLAESVGAIEGAGPAVSEDEWRDAERQCVARGDCADPCAICHEQFGLREQVLLSCSHTFHRACLGSFERFSGGARRCPLCRHENYERRGITAGADECRRRSAVTIQRVYRGHAARRAFGEALERATGLDPRGALARRRQLGRLQATTARLLCATKDNDSELDRFLAELDRSVECARQTMRDAGRLLGGLPEEEWRAVRARVEARGPLDDCPVCMEEAVPDRPGARPCAVLSCSHVFHRACIESFERFAAGRSDEAAAAGATCPMCRQEYQRCEWDDLFPEDEPFRPAAAAEEPKPKPKPKARAKARPKARARPAPGTRPRRREGAAAAKTAGAGGKVPSYARPRRATRGERARRPGAES